MLYFFKSKCNRELRKKALLTLLLPLFYFSCQAQENWTLRKNENGIAVYSRMLNSEKYKEIRVICEFNSTAERLINLIQDVNNHKNWVYKTTRSYLISRKNKDTLFYYSEIDLPWPASNRDAVTELCVARNSLKKTVFITIKSIPTMLPNKPKLIRVPYSLGQYKVSTLPNNHIKIDYTLSINPGGSLPDWLVNYTAAMAPYKTFIKLKALVENQTL